MIGNRRPRQVSGVMVEPSWDLARAVANEIPTPVGVEQVPLAAADRRVLAGNVVAATALPPVAMSAMDGWAVAGDGPWQVLGQQLAGQPLVDPLVEGQAVRIATGAAVPQGSLGVLRSEHGRVTPDGVLDGSVRAGQDLRPAGAEAVAGEVLIAAGTVLSPVHLGLAAAGGLDGLVVFRRPRVRVLVFGDELLDRGPARDGRVRDSLGPQLPAWLTRMGLEVLDVVAVADTLDAHRAALAATGDCDVVVTTGGTAAGPVDFLHAALAYTGGGLVVDSVAVRPGHPMVLGRWEQRPGDLDGRGCRWLVGLPGNPQAAVVALVTLGVPLVAGLFGRPLADLGQVVLDADLAAPPGMTRLVAAALGSGRAVPVGYAGSGMLRGLASADGFAVVPAGGAPAGSEVRWLPLPS